MTNKMMMWQMEKIGQMQDLTSEIITGIADALEYTVYNSPEGYQMKGDTKISTDELVIMEKMLEMCANNIDLCGFLIESWNRYLEQYF